jgi:hypothetical protein
MSASVNESVATLFQIATSVGNHVMNTQIVQTWVATFCLFNVKNANQKWKIVVPRNVSPSFICLKKNKFFSGKTKTLDTMYSEKEGYNFQRFNTNNI